MIIMEGQGVGGHVGDEFPPVFFFHDGLKWCRHNAFPVQYSESQSGEKFQQARTKGWSNHDSHYGSHVRSEYQSGSKQARVNGRTSCASVNSTWANFGKHN